MKPALFLALVLGAYALPALAQTPPPAVETMLSQSALVTLPAKGGARLTVTSPAFADGADIPFENTNYRNNSFPGLNWSGAPAGTQSFVLIMQDTDGMQRMLPILHWTMFNIPATATSLAAGLTSPPAGASFGPNLRGSNQPYFGPRTPAGPKHRYHFQLFALDTRLALDPASASYEQLTEAMKDHVLASGQIIGLGQVDPSAPPPAARGATPGAASAAPSAGAAPLPDPAGRSSGQPPAGR